MDYSKHPIYGADYVSAVLVAIALTIVLASAIRQNDYRAWREAPSKLLLLVLGSWMSGFLIFFLGEVIARWLPLVAAVASFFLIAFTIIGAVFPRTRRTAQKHQSPKGVRAALAVYFCATTALLIGTLFARWYVVYLS